MQAGRTQHTAMHADKTALAAHVKAHTEDMLWKHTILLNCLQAVSQHPEHYGVLVGVKAFLLLHALLQSLIHLHSSQAGLPILFLPAHYLIERTYRLCKTKFHKETRTERSDVMVKHIHTLLLTPGREEDEAQQDERL